MRTSVWLNVVDIVVSNMNGKDGYLTIHDVNKIMNNLDILAAYECLGRMSKYIERYELDMIYKDRWMQSDR